MYRLLIADDEQIERIVLHKMLLSYLGDICEIYEAGNGREALELYREKKIQIVILDIEMPGINGIQAAEKIRETDMDCCIIFLTAFDEFSYAKKAVSIRALEYLLKPYHKDELLAALDEAIRITQKRENDTKPLAPVQEKTAPVAAENAEEMDLPQARLFIVAGVIRAYICDHYMEDISMQDMAHMMNYSEAYFCKLFKQCFSCNFTAYLTQLRLEEAKKLLAQPTVNVKDIGEAVGYSDSNYFAKVFKRYTAMSPTEYRIELFRQL